MKDLSYTLSRESITVIHLGKSYAVQKGTANFEPLRLALIDERWDDAVGYLTIAKGIEQWAKGDFKVNGETISYKGQPLPASLNKRIIASAAKSEDPTFLFRFWERLQLNPSWRSVQQVFPFLEHDGIPITEDGCFLAYKAVRPDYMDFHSGTVKNSIGSVHEMPRNQISDDPKEACHFGFHVGALSYAQSFGESNRRIVICKVDPADVVCVPYDSAQRKMRVCRYEVTGHYAVKLPSTTYREETPKVETPKAPAKETKAQEKAKEPPKGAKAAAPKAKAPTAPKEAPKPDTASPDAIIFKRMDELDEDQLLEANLGLLRTYAAQHLKIVGASKIPGGKLALVGHIIKART